jgi:hypothetical protein
MKELSVRWSQMDDKAKIPYTQMAQEDKLRYEGEIQALRDIKMSKSTKRLSVDEEKMSLSPTLSEIKNPNKRTIKKSPMSGKSFLAFRSCPCIFDGPTAIY